MSIFEEIKENLEIQVHELEALQSVYPKELKIADHGILADVNNFINRPTEELPQKLEYSIEISIDSAAIELLVSLTNNYPKEKPEIYARSSLLNRTQQLLLNETLNAVLEQQEKGEPCIYMLISWLQDNAEEYIIASKSNHEKVQNGFEKYQEKSGSLGFARYWIYSHHLYSKFKRKDIAYLAKKYSITGFCLAGKPGVICMEGALEDCDYCWQKIKAMNWQRILVKLMEKEEECKDIDTMRKFMDFQEISFPSSERHNDMGHLLKYLTEHQSQHVFKELFGLKGKSTELMD